VRFLVERGAERIELYTTLDLRTPESIEHELRLVSRESYEQGAALSASKKWEQAIPYLERAVLFNYRDVRAHELLGYACLRAKRFEQALSAYQAAANAAPDSPAYRFWIAVSYDRLGNREKAIESYETYLQSGHTDRKMTRDARKRAEYLRTAPQREAETSKALIDMIEAIRQEISDPDGKPR
jgi:tetratricopeptide (TPR) repeat protein